MPQAIIEDVLAGSDLVSLVRETTPLRAASNHHLAHCPFHRAAHVDKPSMIIDAETRPFECSVCGFGGFAIGWLMYHDGLSFPESVLALSIHAGFDVSPWITTAETEASLLQRLVTLEACADLYAGA